jgi:hypothetical protein
MIKMQLPKYQKKKREKLKTCQEPGCGAEFIGHPIAKYCELHRNIKDRTPVLRQYDPVDKDNFVFEHGFTQVTEIERICAHEDCGKSYRIQIFPKQKVYPKYCEEHRNNFKRKNYPKKINKIQIPSTVEIKDSGEILWQEEF